jgi:outer membrane lipoprotein carrier protein
MEDHVRRFAALALLLATMTAIPESRLASAAPSKSTPAETGTAKPKRAPLTTQIPKLLREVEAQYVKAGTLEAEFTQVTETAALKRKKTSSGTIQVKRPNKFRWETRKPESEMSLLISDGKKYWYYTPPFDEGERGQLIERKSSETQSRLANALLSGEFSSARGMKFEVITPSTFALFPKKGTAGTVTRAEVEVDSAKKQIRRVTLEHRDGNKAEISLTNIALGKPAEEAAFHFSPPPNTDRVTE